jgi:hypothetical protein
MLITVMGLIAIATPSVIIMLFYAITDHLSSRDIVGANEADKSNGTDMIMGNMSNGD